eukprot:EC096900.1.p1 GENE.EC096900.1~~EC096900.1.p1  ORF type:complete len:193 (-),score=-1.57 EC096900.1:35-613(-)
MKAQQFRLSFRNSLADPLCQKHQKYQWHRSMKQEPNHPNATDFGVFAAQCRKPLGIGMFVPSWWHVTYHSHLAPKTIKEAQAKHLANCGSTWCVSFTDALKVHHHRFQPQSAATVHDSFGQNKERPSKLSKGLQCLCSPVNNATKDGKIYVKRVLMWIGTTGEAKHRGSQKELVKEALMEMLIGSQSQPHVC